MKTLLILGTYIACLSSSYGFTLTEDNLIKMAKGSNPSTAELEASFLASQVNAMELQDRFGFEAYGQYGHVDTNEKAIVSFQPVFTTINQYKVGVKKYSKYGLVLDANTSVTQQSGFSESGSNYKDVHTTRNEIGVQADLWKDFLGRISKAQFDSAKDLQSKDEYQLQISQQVFEINARRLYWNLVANAEKLKITNSLIATGARQLRDAKKRRANSVADSAEVAKFESLVHQRNGQIILLRYEREMLFKNLRQLFPQLNKQEITLGKYNIDKTIFEVVGCTETIKRLPSAPLEHTKYDEVISLLKKVQARQMGVDNTYDDIDLKLDLKLYQVGIASETDDDTNFYGDYGTSRDDIADNDRQGMSAGLVLTIPFGEDKSATTKVKEKLTELRFDAQLANIESNVNSTHTQVKESVELLTNLIKTQKLNSKALAVRVRELEKKYKQARIQEFVLIQDQEALLQSDISVIDTQLTVIGTVFDYLSIFDTYPCAFNRI